MLNFNNTHTHALKASKNLLNIQQRFDLISHLQEYTYVLRYKYKFVNICNKNYVINLEGIYNKPSTLNRDYS